MKYKRLVAKCLTLSAKFVLTVALLWYLFRSVDFRDMLVELKNSNVFLLIAGIVQLSLQPLLASLRWRVVMSRLGSTLPFMQILRITYIGTFFNQALPATVGGDAVRMWLAHKSGCTVKNAMNSIVLDRAAMLMGLILMVALTMPWLAHHIEMGNLIWLVPLLLIGGVSGLAIVMLGDRLSRSLHKWRAARAVAYLAADTRRIFLTPDSLGIVMALSVIGCINIIIAVFFFALAFDQNVPLFYFLTLIPPVILVSTLPISIGGWGTREMAMVSTLSTVAIQPSIALLISAFLGLGSIIISLPGAIFYLLYRHGMTAGYAEQRDIL
ncbi:MAG TPA: lysylphosphatidylglycerol synthase transmembrane domain-containing protein [Burkholderiales bacterium]|nr:lysylphosphatidylglycerol synthase transmembrane domain-containing protein [Burkholderiales bacterium]